MNKFTPLVKGLITGIVMLATTLLLIYTDQPANSGLQYIVYVLYAGGIAWTGRRTPVPASSPNLPSNEER